jgi:homoserine kinase
VALDFYLEIEAQPAPEFSIQATGRNSELCSRLEGNLILDTYSALLQREDKPVLPLSIRMHNQIPLGMGCGSSAAGLLAAVMLASHFGGLGWGEHRVLEEACVLEGHPDNAAACWLGGLVVAATHEHDSGVAGRVSVQSARIEPPVAWRAMVVMPKNPLATSKARAVLPAEYSRADAVANVQAAALLAIAFAQGRGDLLQAATADRFHQPYRAAICPLLPALLPLAGQEGILGVALSGAGPSVLLILSGGAAIAHAEKLVGTALKDCEPVEILIAEFTVRGARGF